MTATACDTRNLLTRQELAYRLGVNPQTIVKWTEEGLPVAERGKGRRPSKYDEASARRWVDAQEKKGDGRVPFLTVARARKEIAQACEAEQRVAMRAGQLIAVDDVRRIWSSEVAAIRARMLGWPKSLTMRICRIAAVEGEAGVERALREAVKDVLTQLAVGGSKTAKHRRRSKR